MNELPMLSAEWAQMQDFIFASFGKAIAYGGGAAAVAMLTFQYLGKKWIENKFSERLELLRHSNAQELQRLKVQVDALLSGAIRLQEKEFLTLPDAWIKLDEAYSKVHALVSPLQFSADLDKLREDQLIEYLNASQLLTTQKNDVLKSSRKSETYNEFNFRHRYHEVNVAVSDLHQYVQRNGIFLPPDLKKLFEQAAEGLWQALVAKETGHSVKDWKIQNEGWKKVVDEVKPLRSSIETAVYSRLQSHAKSIERDV